MFLGRICCFVEKSDRIVLLAGLCIGWLDCIGGIVSLDIAGSGSYRLDRLD